MDKSNSTFIISQTSYSGDLDTSEARIVLSVGQTRLHKKAMVYSNMQAYANLDPDL